jgi:hypothetical protein
LVKILKGGILKYKQKYEELIVFWRGFKPSSKVVVYITSILWCLFIFGVVSVEAWKMLVLNLILVFGVKQKWKEEDEKWLKK